MVRLKFQGMRPIDSVTLGPAEGFRVAGNFLRELPSGSVLGRYERHQWHVRDKHFARYDCIDPCRVHFEDADGVRSPLLGPFQRMHVADGTMYTDEALFAKFVDETVLWHSYELETYWPVLIVQS